MLKSHTSYGSRQTGNFAQNFRLCPEVMMLYALISVSSWVGLEHWLGCIHIALQDGWQGVGREGGALYAYFCFTNNKITCQPERKATSLSSHVSLGSTIFYWIKIEPRSLMHLLKSSRLHSECFDQIFALQQCNKWQGTGGNFWWSSKQNFLNSDRKACSNCTGDTVH